MSAKLSLAIGALTSACLISAWGAPAPTETTPATSTADTPAQDGMRVAIDPVTKRLRPLTAEESRALNARAPQAAMAEAAPRPIATRIAGARGVLLGADSLSYSRAARTAEGQVVTDCVDGEDAAHLHDHPVAASARAMAAEKR